jgi:hypothetical protein
VKGKGCGWKTLPKCRHRSDSEFRPKERSQARWNMLGVDSDSAGCQVIPPEYDPGGV